MLDNAASYVDQYQYVSISDDRKKDLSYRLLVSFNKSTLMDVLNSSGLAVWDVNRAKILLWLVIEQKGKQAFLDIDRNAKVEKAIQDAAMAKGIPLLLPLMDLEEKQAISVIDILAAKPDKILEASSRYDVATILSGKLVKKRTCWSSEWALHFNNKIERWTVSCTDLKTNLNNALQGVYEYLSVFYALRRAMLPHEIRGLLSP
ncbi:hypothetical protein BMR04_09950 [Methylococcaceae bacterium HT3]|nr:hypothetical protein BMR04_09950 [Methylococcaceae bacterium HT3]